MSQTNNLILSEANQLTIHEANRKCTGDISLLHFQP